MGLNPATKITDAPVAVFKTGTLNHTGDGLLVQGCVEGKKCHITIDTGSNISIVRPDILGRHTRGAMQPVESCLKTVTGERAPIRGRIIVNFTIGSQTFSHEAWIADIVDECLLGLDFLGSHDCQVDLKDSILYIGQDEIPLTQPDAGMLEQHCYKAIVCSPVSLPPHSEVIVPAHIEGLRGVERWGIVESTDVNAQDERTLLVGRTLVDLRRREIPVRVMNITNEAKRLKQGTTLAQCQELDSVRSPSSRQVLPCKEEVPPHLLALYERSIAGLSEHEAEQVRQLLCEYAIVFSEGPEDLGRAGVVKHHIRTGDAPPIRQRPRRLPMALREDAGKAVEEMEKQGVIEPSASPWSSPIVLVRKKDGSVRFCVDYRKLNAVTHKDSYPLPRIDDTLEALGGSEWFSTLDLKSGYWQVELAQEDKEKSAFSTGTGLWQFRVMPFGLCNAPATFERLMEQVLSGVDLATALVYLDDILVHAATFAKHLGHLRLVLTRLQQAGLKLSPKKCFLLQRRVKYLGHVISKEGVAMDEEKLEAVRDWPIPTTTKEVRSFLGLCSYYRRFVRGFSDIAHPLHQLTEKNRVFQWTDEAAKAFELLKQKLMAGPILGYPCVGREYVLDTDASDHGIGAVLSQVQEGEERPVAYYSRVLSRPEKQYCTTRKELLAVVKSIQHFRPYLYGVRFTLRTDHAALKWLLNFREPEGQVARWIQQLQEYDCEIQHRAGVRHLNADALSRRPCLEDACRHCERLEERSGDSVPCRAVHLKAPIPRSRDVMLPLDSTALRSAQMEDLDIGPVLRLKEQGGEKPQWAAVSPLSQGAKGYWAQWQSLTLQEGVLYREWETPTGDAVVKQLVLPQKFRSEVLSQLHDSISGGHLGNKKTLGKVRERFYWLQCQKDVKRWIQNCDLCASRSGPQRKNRAPMGQYNVGAPLERIAIDVMGPLPTTKHGNKYLLVVQDYFTKWVEAYSIPNQEAVTVAEVLVQEFVSRLGVPMAIHSDQGRNFESAVFTEMCTLLGVGKTRTTPLHPQSDGMVERFNRTIEAQLSKFVDYHQDDWDQCVPLLLMAYRTSIHETTGCTPAMMMMGRDLRLPIDLIFGRPEEEPSTIATDYAESLQERLELVHRFVRPHMEMQSDRMKEYYDSHSKEGHKLGNGDAVWLYNPRRKKGISPKLQRSWEGPYVIIKKINDLVYRIQLGPRTKPKVVHRNRLWLYTGEEVPTWIGVDQQSGNVDETRTSTAADAPVPSNSIRASVSPPEETKTKTTESTSRYPQRSRGKPDWYGV